MFNLFKIFHKKTAFDVALEEVKKQGRKKEEQVKLKGIEQLDEYYRKHPQKQSAHKRKKKKH